MIYAPDEDTFFLLDSVIPRGKVLEMGAGSGYISIEIAKKGYDVTAVDLDAESIEMIKKVSNNVKTIVSDLFKCVNGRFDTIIFNPPYLPGTIDDDRTIYGGKNGQEIVEQFLDQADAHLEKNGKIFIILSSFNDIESLERRFKNFCFRRIGEKKFAFHSIYVYLIWRCGDEGS